MENKKKSVLIVGCGWLGFPLAKRLVHAGYLVSGTTTTKAKLKEIEAIGAVPIHFAVGDQGVELPQADVLVFNVPPSKVDGKYVDMVEAFLQKVSANTRIVFVSSTSVFGENQGECNEETLPVPTSVSGRNLLACEQIVAGRFGSYVVFRPAGLMGPGRHPGQFFKGKAPVFAKEERVNMIDLASVIDLLARVIELGNFNGILHACLPEHPEKQAFYSKAFALFSRNEMVGFEHQQVKKNKIIQSNRLTELNFRYAETNLFKVLEHISAEMKSY